MFSDGEMSVLTRRSICFMADLLIPEFSVYNPGALFRKSPSDNIDFLNCAPGVVYGKLWHVVFSAQQNL